MLTGQGLVRGLVAGRPHSPARRFHSNQLTTSRARLEKSPLGRGLRRNNSSRLPSTPPPTATPSALLRVFTVLTLARNRSVMSTAMATCTSCPRPRGAGPRQHSATAVRARPLEDRSGSALLRPPTATREERFRLPRGFHGERKKVPASARALDGSRGAHSRALLSSQQTWSSLVAKGGP